MLDPFGGSGTTLAVAKKLGRRFLGFELSKRYAKQIEKRLAAIAPGDPLDGAPEPLVSVPNTANGRRLDEVQPAAGPARSRRKEEGGRRHKPLSKGGRPLWGDQVTPPCLDTAPLHGPQTIQRARQCISAEFPHTSNACHFDSFSSLRGCLPVPWQVGM